MSERIKVTMTRTKRANANRAEWWFTIIDLSNGEPLARSTEGYYNYDEAIDAVVSVTGGERMLTRKGGNEVYPTTLVRGGGLPPVVIEGDVPARR